MGQTATNHLFRATGRIGQTPKKIEGEGRLLKGSHNSNLMLKTVIRRGRRRAKTGGLLYLSTLRILATRERSWGPFSASGVGAFVVLAKIESHPFLV